MTEEEVDELFGGLEKVREDGGDYEFAHTARYVVKTLTEELMRARATLHFYADKENYNIAGAPIDFDKPIGEMSDRGKQARAFLGLPE